MKTCLALLALVLTAGTTAAHADPFTASLMVDGSAVALVETQVGNLYTLSYVDNTTTLYSLLPPSSTIDNDVFTATYLDTGIAGVLTVTSVCANVGILHTANPCNAYAFSFTNLVLANALAVNVDLGTSVTANASLANFEIGGGNIALGGGVVNFSGNPPTSPVPEPGTLGMMATGLIGAAGALRRKFNAA